MEKCKSCQADIATSAKVCPQCGAKNKKQLYKRWWFWLIIVIVISAIGSNSAKNDNATSTTASNNNQTVAKTNVENAKTTTVKTTDIIVSAVDLANAFEDNEIRANQAYKGKTAEIAGKIDDIGEILGQTFITLSAGKDFAITQTQCFFKDKEEIKKIATLNKGDEVVIIGKISGKSLNVSVDNCIIKYLIK